MLTESQLREAFDALAVQVWFLDAELRVVSANRAAASLAPTSLPFTAEQLQRHRDALRSGQPLLRALETYALDGQARWARVDRLPVQGGLLVVLDDVSEFKQAEEALRRDEAEARRLAVIASRTDNLVVLTDAEGRIEWVNDAFVRVTEYTLDEVRGQKPGSILQGPKTDAATVLLMRERLRQGLGFNVEILNYTKSGRRYWLAIEVLPLHDDLGRVTQFMAIQSEITKRKEVEAALVQAKEAAEEANRAKTRFLATISHEIRTPLHGILGMAELLRGDELPPAAREHLAILQDSASSLLILINDLLDLSRIEAGRLTLDLQPFDLLAKVQRVVRTLEGRAQQKGLELTAVVAPDVPPAVVGDAVRLRQVLLILLDNAIKFTDQGRVTLSVRRAASNGLRFAVTDTGIGIAPEKRAAIFEPFVQAERSTARDYGGTGLGLAIAARLVGLMHGTIAVDSAPGRGSTFHFTVALAPTAPLPAADASASSSAVTRTLRILVAEDNPVNQRVAVQLLQRAGHQVRVVTTGRQALAALEQERFDVVLMDVQMPELDGLQTAAEMRRREAAGRPRVPIVAVTAQAMPGDQAACLRAGMDGFVSKPIRWDLLAATLARVVGEPAPAAVPPPTDLLNKAGILARMGGHLPLVRQILACFEKESPRQLAELRTALNEGNAAGVRHTAHKLAGSLGNFDQGRMLQLARELEARGAAGDLHGAAGLLKELEPGVTQLLAAVHAWLDPQG